MIAADASTVRFGLRASHVKGAALADQILFAMFLPGADLTLAASLYRRCDNNERQMLFECPALVARQGGGRGCTYRRKLHDQQRSVLRTHDFCHFSWHGESLDQRQPT